MTLDDLIFVHDGEDWHHLYYAFGPLGAEAVYIDGVRVKENLRHRIFRLARRLMFWDDR